MFYLLSVNSLFLLFYNKDDMKKITAGLLALFLFSCSSPKSLKEKISGKWYMSKVYEMGDDVTTRHNPQNKRWIQFNVNGTFESGGEPAGYNTGKWSIDLNNNILFLDSDAGEDDDSYWILKFEDNVMKWQGTKFEFNKRFKIEHEKR